MPRPSNDTQAFLTGLLYGQLAKWQAEYQQGDGYLKITDVHPDMDDEGNYLNIINVTLESGLVLQVRVDELIKIDEE
jgi:hypothetical protein